MSKIRRNRLSMLNPFSYSHQKANSQITRHFRPWLHSEPPTTEPNWCQSLPSKQPTLGKEGRILYSISRAHLKHPIQEYCTDKVYSSVGSGMRIWFWISLANLVLSCYCYLYRGVTGAALDFADHHKDVVGGPRACSCEFKWFSSASHWHRGLLTAWAPVGKQQGGAGAEAMKHESGVWNGLVWYFPWVEDTVCEELRV